MLVAHMRKKNKKNKFLQNFLLKNNLKTYPCDRIN